MRKKRFKGVLAALLGAATAFAPAVPCAQIPLGIVSYADNRTGTVDATSLNVRKGPGTGYSSITRLNKGARVTVLEETQGTDGNKWYKISYGSVTGYVSASYIRIGSTNVVTDSNFESVLSSEGFPESYRPMLRELHAQYPNWSFKAYKTGLSWNTVIEEESKVGRNLVERNNISSWKSTEDGAYDWNTGTWTGFDGSTWVAASREIIEYYMDPRNFLNDSYIFQFMDQSYNQALQSTEGLTQMVQGTFLAGTVSGGSSGSSSVSSSTGSSSGPGSTGSASGPGASASASGPGASGPAAPGQSGSGFTDTTSNTAQSDAPGSQPGGSSGETYVGIIMDAAQASGVNPYIIASMILQEQGAQGQGRSISGNVTGYNGYYNFFNIEAYTSGSMSAVERGLWWASQSGSYGRPWNSVRASIVGGATWYGENYVKRGQVNLYLKKYNVTSEGRYKHQYMTNVLGAAAEGLSLAKISALKESPVVFTIPVYNDMPADSPLKPTGDGSPNNRLRGFGVEGFQITPSFNNNTVDYEVSVNQNVTSLKVVAAAIDSAASVSGTGDISIADGRNAVAVKVTAENGSVRTYTIKINRSANGPEYNGSIQPEMSAAIASSSGSSSGSSQTATGPGMSSASWTTRTSSGSSSGSSSSGSSSGSSSSTASSGSTTGPGGNTSVTIHPVESSSSGGQSVPSKSGVTSITKGPGESESSGGSGYHAWEVLGPGLGRRN